MGGQIIAVVYRDWVLYPSPVIFLTISRGCNFASVSLVPKLSSVLGPRFFDIVSLICFRSKAFSLGLKLIRWDHLPGCAEIVNLLCAVFNLSGGKAHALVSACYIGSFGISLENMCATPWRWVWGVPYVSEKYPPLPHIHSPPGQLMYVIEYQLIKIFLAGQTQLIVCVWSHDHHIPLSYLEWIQIVQAIIILNYFRSLLLLFRMNINRVDKVSTLILTQLYHIKDKLLIVLRVYFLVRGITSNKKNRQPFYRSSVSAGTKITTIKTAELI